MIAASTVLEDMEFRQRLLSLLFFVGYSLYPPLMVAFSEFSIDASIMCGFETLLEKQTLSTLLPDSSISISFLALLHCFLLAVDLSGQSFKFKDKGEETVLAICWPTFTVPSVSWMFTTHQEIAKQEEVKQQK